MSSGQGTELSLDGKHIWFEDSLYTFEEAKKKAHEILDLINGAEAEKEIRESEDAAGTGKKPG